LLKPKIPMYLDQKIKNKPLSFLVISVIMLTIPIILYLIFIRQKDVSAC
jgi:hypothetical protein